MSTVKISSILGEMFRFLYGNVFCYICHKSNRKSKSDKNNDKDSEMEQNYDDYEGKNKNVEVVDDDEEHENEEDKDNVTVPLVLVLSAYFGYLALGGYIFTSIEPTWNMREGCYFSFVSLSTIGNFNFYFKVKISKFYYVILIDFSIFEYYF